MKWFVLIVLLTLLLMALFLPDRGLAVHDFSLTKAECHGADNRLSQLHVS